MEQLYESEYLVKNKTVGEVQFAIAWSVWKMGQELKENQYQKMKREHGMVLKYAHDLLQKNKDLKRSMNFISSYPFVLIKSFRKQPIGQ